MFTRIICVILFFTVNIIFTSSEKSQKGLPDLGEWFKTGVRREQIVCEKDSTIQGEVLAEMIPCIAEAIQVLDVHRDDWAEVDLSNLIVVLTTNIRAHNRTKEGVTCVSESLSTIINPGLNRSELYQQAFALGGQQAVKLVHKHAEIILSDEVPILQKHFSDQGFQQGKISVWSEVANALSLNDAAAVLQMRYEEGLNVGRSEEIEKQ